MKNNIDVFYFSCLIPLNVLFVEDGKMGKYVLLSCQIYLCPSSECVRQSIAPEGQVILRFKKMEEGYSKALIIANYIFS